MAKVTSKLQVTIPKVIADQYGIRPGDHVGWSPAGDSIRVSPVIERSGRDDTRRRLELFRAATARQRAREAGRPVDRERPQRGWTREDLYDRGRAG